MIPFIPPGVERERGMRSREYGMYTSVGSSSQSLRRMWAGGADDRNNSGKKKKK